MRATDSFISTFSMLGEFLTQFPDSSRNEAPEMAGLNRAHFESFKTMLEDEQFQNPWFTPESVKHALKGIATMLEERVLMRWLEAYKISPLPASQVKTVGLVLAGNIPLVGFHDMMSVLAAGHRVLAKPSTKDDRLIRAVAALLAHMDSSLGKRIIFTEDKLTGVDAVIATGSNNSARYFEYYFRDVPHIIRKNRNGIAVLTGKESEEELAGIGKDIFTYFGLGCRNVTKLYIPESYDLKVLLAVLDRYHELYQHHKYGNNVDYYRTIYLMNQVPILDNGVLLLKEDQAIGSPVGVVFYERYSEIGWVQDQLMARSEEIQCCVSIHSDIPDALIPGTTQEPMPWDYADGVDTIRFLTELN
ncbi:MAG: acyl-CoA reductase [Bacteroidota bacterium]